MSGYASSSSSDSPLPEKVSSIEKTKSKEKGKHKEKQSARPSVVVTPHGKNEGTNTVWAYAPPDGFSLANHDSVDPEEFDWDSLKDGAEDLELWIIRVPGGIKAKHLQGLKLDEPSSSKTARVGSLERKHDSYDVWSLGDEDADVGTTVGAEELRSVSCLLPRKKKNGKLYPAPKVPVRRLVLNARPALPTPAPSPEGSDRGWATHQNPPRPAYPKEVLKHRFVPIGALARSQGADENGDIDMEAPQQADVVMEEEGKAEMTSKQDGEGKAKKRKAEKSSDSKRSRKVKVQ